MNLSQINSTKFIPLHILFWTAVWFFFVYFFSYNSTDTIFISWFSSFLLPVTMGATYFTVYFLIPKYLLSKKYKLFILYSIYTLVFVTYFVLLTIFGSFIFLSDLKVTNIPPMSRNFVFVLILVYLIVGIVSFISLLMHNLESLAKNKNLGNTILETQLQIKKQELNYLKKQIHPHFLFNTLNTIYGFALRKSEQTPEIILKLSNLLDYILYQVTNSKVALKEEILHIKEYIELEKIRFQDTLEIFFEADEIPEKLEIPPMLLIPFIENAFKHGSIVNGNLTVNIKLELSDGKMIFLVKNSFINEESETQKNGIGLENIRKRLTLLYQENYTLEVEKGTNFFAVKLLINV